MIWIARDRPRSADAVINRILTGIERLGRFPYIGRPGRVVGTNEWVVRGLPYIVVYTVSPEAGEVTIDAVFHARQQR
jgi:toxin ParE1/3/4